MDSVAKLKPTTSALDIIPTQICDSVGDWILAIINTNLLSGSVPSFCKHAVVKPLLKKPNLDTTVLSHFRPISNLPFIAKILEKAVFMQNFLATNRILEKFQSGLMKNHSTESALLRV